MINSYADPNQYSIKEQFNLAVNNGGGLSLSAVLESQAQAFDNNQPEALGANYTQAFKF